MWELFWKLLKPYKGAVIFVLVLTFLQTLANLYLPTLMANIVDIGIVKTNVPYIVHVGLWMLLVSALGVAFSIVASYYSAKVSSGFGMVLRNDVFTHVESFSRQGFDTIGTASLITRTTDDITRLQQVLTMILRMMIMAPMMSIGGILMAVMKNGRLSLILLAVIPILGVSIWLITRSGLPLFRLLQKRMDGLNLVVREGLTGIRVIRAFNREAREEERFDEANENLADTAVRVNRIMSLLMPVMMVLMNFSTIAIVWFGSRLINVQQLQVGDLMAFIQYAMQIMFSLIMVSMMFVMIPRGAVSAVRINEVLHTDIDIADPVNPLPLSPDSTGEVEFRNVSFQYPGAEAAALKDVTFRAESGKVTAVIGGTGCGKSTLVRLLPRLFDASSGHILLGGEDIRQLTQVELRSKIGFVPQQALLFTGTVADNIRYGRETASMAEIQHAAHVAQADEFIQEMPEGYDAVITQGGSNLSGGQKQRLSIARALVRRPDIYIFDDSFSALDAKTDALLRTALFRETGDATVIIVSQRVSTILNADKIVVLDEGRVAGIGKHSDLMESCGVYRELVASQLAREGTA
ncbi:ABC transporter ATP-binding protein [Alicyclobacillus sp. SO9]|uniref:ABC transporter ATP-binding protein n=1 Tax=Alicyclobacillus sp. SO9 TaxID=2665646 RepID=UPI0018E761F9|nr:ABC transporter ATP-binding protein [Alicyclobacillus sp. SO9]QQE81081.1 ABC transporter ATP-binding protein [Alicyclobacillus sp. SO9]